MDNKVMFHFIGDSHTWIFLEKLPNTVDEMIATNCINNYIPLNNEITLFSWRYSGIDGALAYQISKRSEIIDYVINNYVSYDI